MPTYELTCRTCGTSFEKFLMRLLRLEDKVCPACGSSEVGVGVGGGYVKPTAESRVSCGGQGGFG